MNVLLRSVNTESLELLVVDGQKYLPAYSENHDHLDPVPLLLGDTLATISGC
ncbi:MAG: hypothetical protein ACSLEL_01295 [Candidatus Malihini olakiniferum]